MVVAHCGINMMADVANQKQYKPEALCNIVFMLYLHISILLIQTLIYIISVFFQKHPQGF